jgi:nicotinamidase-related amidase
MNEVAKNPPIRKRDRGLSRMRPVEAGTTALLVIDVQNGTFNAAQEAIRPEFFVTARDVVIPNLTKLIAGCRKAGVEVIYTVIENQTRDGRDRSLDYKLSDFFFAKGSLEGKVLDAIAPGEDELVIPKTSSSLFNSTNIDYLLRNIGITDLAITGFLTDQCIDHTVKDAADRGYYPTCITDACMANTHERHRQALAMFAGYCRQVTSAEWLAGLPKGHQ